LIVRGVIVGIMRGRHHLVKALSSAKSTTECRGAGASPSMRLIAQPNVSLLRKMA
jgi:hypothetical protein